MVVMNFELEKIDFRVVPEGDGSHYGDLRLLLYMRLCELHDYGETLLCCQRNE